MCTNTNQEDFIIIHHEMGHIEYQMAYSEVDPGIEYQNKYMPLIFRDGANPGRWSSYKLFWILGLIYVYLVVVI